MQTTRQSSRQKKTKTADAIPVDLALQGGGAHGAFTWGVLDCLLEQEHLLIDGISGTSAGAMNAAVLASGYAAGGRQGARQALDAFWRRVSDAARMSPLKRAPLDILLGRWSLRHTPAFMAMELTSRLFSPYDLNPSGLNPLKAVLNDSIDFQLLASSPIKIFVTATCVSTGLPRIFRNQEAGVDALLASACLPQMFQAVEIDGQAYWDGGYSGNPTISPLVRECSANDTILVQINPVDRPDVPKSAGEIFSRVNEISFNAPLLKELRMIAVLQQVADPGRCEGALWAQMRIHRIESERMMQMDYSSKLNAEWASLVMLRDEGRRAAQAFLQTEGPHLGKRSTLDLSVLLEAM